LEESSAFFICPDLSTSSRKFFGNPNGTNGNKSKPAREVQSKLAFHDQAKSNRKPSKKESRNGLKEEEEHDEDGHMVVDGMETKVKKAEPVDVEEDTDSSGKGIKRTKDEQDESSDDEPVLKRRRKTTNDDAESKPVKKISKAEKVKKPTSSVAREAEPDDEVISAEPTKAMTISKDDATSVDIESEAEEDSASEEDEKPLVKAKAREKVQTTLKGDDKDPYPDWKAGDPVPYAALCTTFSLIEMTTKRLIILAYCAAFLRQVLRLTPKDLLPTIQLMINKLAADYEGIELGIGESLIMKAIGETTGRSLQVIKSDQKEIGDLGLVAAKSKSTQRTMFTPKPLTVRGVHEGLMAIAVIQGDGAQSRKIAGIKKLLSSADAVLSGKGTKGVDITKDKGGPSEAKFIIRFLEGKLRLGLAEKTVLPALAHAMVAHEVSQKGKKAPSTDQLEKGESILKSVYRYGIRFQSSLWKTNNT
jgi:DNA ligase-1